MSRLPRLVVLAASLAAAGCSADATGGQPAPAEASAVTVTTAVAESVPLARYIPVSGTLSAQESAEVAAETAGRIIATPVERGSRVAANADLVRISATEVEAQAREAEANAAQIAARLGIAGGASFDVDPRAGSGQRRGQPPPGPHRVRARREPAQEPAHLAVGVRAEERPARVGRAAVRRRRQRRRAAVPVADGGPRAHEPGAEGRRRHRRPGAVCRPGRRALRLGRRLRHQGHQGRLGDAGRSAAHRADRPGAIHLAGRGRPQRQLRGRRLSRRDLHRPGALRLAVGQRRDPGADPGSGGSQSPMPA